MELSILELFLNASLVVKSVIVVLIMASILSWMIIFERWLYINKVKQEFLDFENRFWSDSGLDSLLNASQAEDNQPVGGEYIFQVGYLDYKRLTDQQFDSNTVLMSVQRNMRAALSKEQSLLEKHLPFLATVASVSPYIGLFGTVWGIMGSFQGLSDATQATINAVAPGISEALIATAMGLFAAIPAVIAFNRFTSKADSYLQTTTIFAEELASIFYRESVKQKDDL